ncbi:hypothetical protein BaRGS_00019972 [Batillaria attramentaria]|uniref:Uncharacterized protein n=1 Tax=Batillaria attramentaria TaxID=370345 RepID=A0ABD0KNR2_9CAEN
MMCDVMPTISEDGSNDRESQGSGDESNFEQLMVNMLDERDKLMETLRESQESLAATQAKLQEVEKDRNNLQKQLAATTPQNLVIRFGGPNLTVLVPSVTPNRGENCPTPPVQVPEPTQSW